MLLGYELHRSAFVSLVLSVKPNIKVKGGEGPSDTTVVILNISCHIGATCFDSTESSSGLRVLDLYKECTTHCGIPSAYNNKNNIDYNTVCIVIYIIVLYFLLL